MRECNAHAAMHVYGVVCYQAVRRGQWSLERENELSLDLVEMIMIRLLLLLSLYMQRLR